MSAIDELKKINFPSDLDCAVIFYGDDDSEEARTDAENAANELLDLRADNTEKDARLREWLELYDITMPCGHKNRYLMTNGSGDLAIDDKGDCQCVMCDLADAKARAKTAEENWHKNEVRLGKLQMVADGLVEIVEYDTGDARHGLQSLAKARLAEYEELKETK